MAEDRTMEMLERLVRIETILNGLGNADQTANKALLKAEENSKRLDKIDGIIFWVSTTVIGAVILALVSLVIIKS